MAELVDAQPGGRAGPPPESPESVGSPRVLAGQKHGTVSSPPRESGGIGRRAGRGRGGVPRTKSAEPVGPLRFLDGQRLGKYSRPPAKVAELVDEQVSGTCG